MTLTPKGMGGKLWPGGQIGPAVKLYLVHIVNLEFETLSPLCL